MAYSLVLSLNDELKAIKDIKLSDIVENGALVDNMFICM
jgi:hypothetical protein